MSYHCKKFPELESLRGLAAMLVFFHHLPKWNPILNINLINNGYLMVELFFVLSGFVICKAYADKLNSWRDIFKFQFLRFGRLYPVHIFFLLMFISIEITKYIYIAWGNSLKVAPFTTNSFEALIEQLLLLQSVLPNGNATTYNPPAWSISVEFYTYLIFALLILLNKKPGRIFLIISSISVLILIIDITYEMKNLIRCFAGFFLGCSISCFLHKITTKPSRYISLQLLLLLIVFLQTKNSSKFDFLIFILTAVLITSLISTSDGILNKILTNKILLWLGEISYTIYMSQVFVIWAVSQFLLRIIKKTEIVEQNTVCLSIYETVFFVFITVIVVLSFSQVIYLWIEKPLRDQSREFISSFNNKGRSKGRRAG
jgi:peptidoglycan/LPS O-acetylase OafA/YrhL